MPKTLNISQIKNASLPLKAIRLSGYQPQYFPRLHYYNRVLNSDVFELSDYVQFVKKHDFPTPEGGRERGKSFQAHTLIKLNQGAHFLSIPVNDSTSLPINQTQIDYHSNWTYKHLESIKTGYSKSLNFRKYFKELEEILQRKYKTLSDLNIQTFLWGLLRLLTEDPLEINHLSAQTANDYLASFNRFRLKSIFIASQSAVAAPEKGKANEWIIALCKYANASEYFHGGTSSSSYMDEASFKKSGIKTVIQNWHCLPYTQQYQKAGFSPNLSIIDLIMNERLEIRQKIVAGGG